MYQDLDCVFFFICIPKQPSKRMRIENNHQGDEHKKNKILMVAKIIQCIHHVCSFLIFTIKCVAIFIIHKTINPPPPISSQSFVVAFDHHHFKTWSLFLPLHPTISFQNNFVKNCQVEMCRIVIMTTTSGPCIQFT